MATELFVYGDESGLDITKPYSVVAGFIGSPRWWDKFDVAWRAVVDEFEEVEPKEFHSIHFFTRKEARKGAKKKGKNPYRDWPEGKAHSYLLALLKVLTDQPRLTPVGSAMDIRDFKSYTWGERNYMTGAQWHKRRKKFVTAGAPSRVYHLPFFLLVGSALQEAKPDKCKVHFVMDEQKVLASGIEQLYARVCSPESPLKDKRKLGDLTWAVSQEKPGIQAADLLAHAYLGWYRKRTRLKGDRETALYTIYGRWPTELGIVKKRGMEKILSELSSEDRQLIRAVPSPAEIQKAKQ